MAAVQLDRYGVPTFKGEAEHFDEWHERSIDLYYSRTGEQQATTAISLRGGLQDVAYEAARKIPHEKLITKDREGKPIIDGVKLLIEIVRVALQKEGPIRVTETFEQVFYAKTVYRARGESMQAYIVRRRREFDKLGELSGSTSVSDDIKTHLLLRFSGLTMTQRTSAIASVGNVFELTKIEHALRTQFPTIHEHERPSASSTPHGRSWNTRRAGKGSPSSYGVWTADEDEGFFEPSFEQNDTYEAEFDEGAQEYDESYEVYDEEFDEEDLPQEDDDQETAEAYAAFVQARSAFQHRRKGKGKGKFKKGKGKGNSASTVPPPPTAGTEMSFSGTATFTEQQRAERARRLRVVKSRTTCAACGRFGHWQGDPECAKSGGKSKGKRKGDAAPSTPTTSTSYFVVADDLGFDGISDAYVAHGTFHETVLEPSNICRCCQGGNVNRGANGAHRWVDCRVCRGRIHTAHRTGQDSGIGLWIYFMLNLVLRDPGASRRIWLCAFRRRLQRLASAILQGGHQRAVRNRRGFARVDPWLRASEPEPRAEAQQTQTQQIASAARRLLQVVPVQTPSQQVFQMIEEITDGELCTLAMQFRAHIEQRVMAALAQAPTPSDPSTGLPSCSRFGHQQGSTWRPLSTASSQPVVTSMAQGDAEELPHAPTDK